MTRKAINVSAGFRGSIAEGLVMKKTSTAESLYIIAVTETRKMALKISLSLPKGKIML
jgi:hypothetical protein